MEAPPTLCPIHSQVPKGNDILSLQVKMCSSYCQGCMARSQIKRALNNGKGPLKLSHLVTIDLAKATSGGHAVRVHNSASQLHLGGVKVVLNTPRPKVKVYTLSPPKDFMH